MSSTLTWHTRCGNISLVRELGVSSIIGEASYNLIVLHGLKAISRTPGLSDRNLGSWDGLLALKG